MPNRGGVQNSAGVGWQRTTTNIALKIVRADSQETVGEDGKAPNAIDAKPGTFWHTQWQQASPGHPHEIVIELIPTSTICGFIYLPRQDGEQNGMVKDYEFFVSSDGIDFGKPVAKGAFARDREVKRVDFDGRACRFIKLKALSEVNSKPWTSAAEIDVLPTLGQFGR